MSISRNIILDLLPAYIAGEASAETRALIDEYAAGDAQIARLIRSGGTEALPAVQKSALPDSVEMRAMKKMRRRIRRQGWYLGFAIFCTVTMITYSVDDTTGIHWTILEHPPLAILLGIAAIALWAGYFQSKSLTKAGL